MHGKGLNNASDPKRGSRGSGRLTDGGPNNNLTYDRLRYRPMPAKRLLGEAKESLPTDGVANLRIL